MNLEIMKQQALTEDAMQTRARHGYTANAAILKTHISIRKYSINFRFENGLNVGDKGVNPDGSKFEVLAVI